MYSREDWELFRSIETLCQKAGVNRNDLPTLVAKELVDNALDAIEKQNDGIVTIGLLENNGFYVHDNGSGIPESMLARLFSLHRLTSSKLMRLPTRGTLGNGLRVVTGSVLASGGNMFIHTRGKQYQLIPHDNGEIDVKYIEDTSYLGTRIEIYFGASLQMIESDLRWAKVAIEFNIGESYSGNPSPYWYDTDAFYELAQASKDQTVRDFISGFDGCSGKRAGIIADGYQECYTNDISRHDTDILLYRARNEAKSVSIRRLGYIGDVFADKDLYYSKQHGKFALSTGRGQHNADIPFLVEAWASVTHAENPEFQVTVNKTPVTGSVWAQADKTELLLVTGSVVIGRAKLGRTKCDIYINIQTPYMPIMSDGKAPDLSHMADVIVKAVNSAVRKAKRGNRKDNPRQKVPNQKDIIFDNIPIASDSLRGDRGYRFSQRQLYYAIRPKLLDVTRNPDYKWFSDCITQYENIHGDILGMYRDTRGALYHPHLGEEMPIGTLEVEEYKRPAWTFNKILYIEKQGFFSTLKAEKWCERNDCALLTSKGQASRAAKDLLDFLGDTKEQITFYCIHDADASGTMIYQALQEATAAREARRVRIINLGLEPWEALEMSLQIEHPSYRDTQAVADYVKQRTDQNWEQWLQNNRVELNAMTTGLFIDWLDYKMSIADDTPQKVTPPLPVIGTQLQDNVREYIEEKIRDEVLRDANFERLVQDTLSNLNGELYHTKTRILDDIRQAFNQNDTQSWRDIVKKIADSFVKENAA